MRHARSLTMRGWHPLDALAYWCNVLLAHAASLAEQWAQLRNEKCLQYDHAWHALVYYCNEYVLLVHAASLAERWGHGSTRHQPQLLIIGALLAEGACAMKLHKSTQVNAQARWIWF
jgi:hypothetical protein